MSDGRCTTHQIFCAASLHAQTVPSLQLCFPETKHPMMKAENQLFRADLRYAVLQLVACSLLLPGRCEANPATGSGVLPIRSWSDPSLLLPLAEWVAPVPVKAQRFEPLDPAWRQDPGAPCNALHAAPARACTTLLKTYQL
jgi:hypothetical protein